MGLQGVVRGRKFKKTTIADEAAERPADLVQRDFTADRPEPAVGGGPDLRGDLGGVRLRGVRHRRLLAQDRGLARVELAAERPGARCPGAGALRSARHSTSLVHHSDRGVQYLSIRYTERLAEAGIEPSVGSVGDSYDNALAETIIGLYKTEVIRRNGPWRNLEEVEFATLEWVDWFNNRRLLEPIGNMPPAEFEALHAERSKQSPAMVAGLTNGVSGEPGAVHTDFEYVNGPTRQSRRPHWARDKVPS